MRQLYKGDPQYAAEDPYIRSIRILKPLMSEEDSGNEFNEEATVTCATYAADVGCMATFTHVVELVTAGLSYWQIWKVMELTRSKIPQAVSLFKPVTRQAASHYTRLIGDLGSKAMANIMQAPGW